MKILAVASALLIGVFFPAFGTELKQLRVLPSQMQALPSAVKRQYEYDPEIGKVGTSVAKLIAVEYLGESYSPSIYIGRGSGVTVSVLPAYHGFTSIQTHVIADGPDRCHGTDNHSEDVKVVFSKTGSWPSTVFKIYKESVSSIRMPCLTRYNGQPDISVNKILTECRQIKVGSSSAFGIQLPGRIYEYSCKSFAVYDWAGKVLPTTESTTLYSEYLDTLVSIRVHKQGGVDNTQPPSTRTAFTYLDETGIKQRLEMISDGGWIGF